MLQETLAISNMCCPTVDLDNDTISDQISHQALIQVVSFMCNRSFTSLVGQLMERN